METRVFETNPILPAIRRVAAIQGMVVLFAGVLLVTGSGRAMMAALAAAVAGAVAGAVILVQAILRIRCPGCRTVLTRSSEPPNLRCAACGIGWDLASR